MNESRPLAETIFFGTRQIVDPRERAAHLDRACQGDLTLREEVERLLAAEQRADRFFENNPLHLGAVPEALDKVGSALGPYKLLQRIGEGGCGMVYMAEQEKPIRRRVALKVIKPGTDTRQVIARFEAERQALAMMDHPNIARVLDAGATDSGRPYFVMELVRGIKITDYCDQNNLGTRERLELFAKVAQAVQHAHQKGIIHRDLKPSNVLVTLHDGVPVPKVIDFGIAKAMEQKLTDKTLFTQFEQFIGTPAYTSPEQAEMSGLDVDTRSDIYSLGVLLYELLVGTTPFDARDLLHSGLDEMRRIIREKEPDRPSTRLSTMLAKERTNTAQRRAASPPELIHLLKGDLDWIVMKCLEKDRTRRYETASGLASDIQNYLGHEPVTARPPSVAYRVGKLVRRHKLACAAGAAVALALVLGLVVSAWQAHRAHRAEMAAKAEKESAEAVLKFFRENVLAAGRPEGMSGGLGKDVTLRKAIDSAESKIAEAFKDRPEVEAAIRLTIGDTYSFLGDQSLAIGQFERALALSRQSLGPEHPDTIAAMALLAFGYQAAWKPDLALPLAEQVFAMRKATLGSEHPDTLASMGGLVQAYRGVNRHDRALALAEEQFKIEQRISPHEASFNLAEIRLAVTHSEMGKLDQAVTHFEAGLKGLKAKEPGGYNTIVHMSSLGWAYLNLGKNDRALALFEETYLLAKSKLGLEHRLTMRALYGLIRALWLLGKLDEAETLANQALSEAPAHKATVSAVRSLRGDLRLWGSRWNEALTDYTEAIRLEPTANPYVRRAQIHGMHGRFPEAATDLVAVIRMEPATQEHYHKLTACLIQQGDLEAYRTHCSNLVARFGETTDAVEADRTVKDCSVLPGSGVSPSTLDRLANVAVAAGETHSGFPWFLFAKGLVDYRNGRYAAAAAAMQKVLDHGGSMLERDVGAWAVLAMARYRLHESDQARSALAQGAQLAETRLPKFEKGERTEWWVDWVFAHALLREARSLSEAEPRALTP